VKILVVEDNHKMLRFLRRVLVDEGYLVDTCTMGSDAIEQAVSGVYDLMVLDWMIPDPDGPSVCRQLRTGGCAIPILMLTARSELKERVVALNAGADDYLAKPFEVEELCARVKALLRRSNGNSRLVIGPIEIDRTLHQARLYGMTMELTDREFALLAHLVRNADAIVTRNDLLAQVWTKEFDPESNVVEVNISRLRIKLGPHARMLETVRGKGYRLSTQSG
jgi:DNA-binding response OmpR family regulator